MFDAYDDYAVALCFYADISLILMPPPFTMLILPHDTTLEFFVAAF